MFLFFFSSRRRHTRSLCDWSSDVCSSDLRAPAHRLSPARRRDRAAHLGRGRHRAARRAVRSHGAEAGERIQCSLSGYDRRVAHHVGTAVELGDDVSCRGGSHGSARERREDRAPGRHAGAAMKRERGLAAVTAILIVAVAASAATLMLAQQSAMLDQTMLIASRAQAEQYSRAGLDWVRGRLLEDAVTAPQFDSLDEGWAQPIAALPVERAVVSGAITDEQGKFNLNNMVNGVSASKPDIEVFRRILASQGLAPELADAVVDWIDGDEDLFSTAGAESADYLPLPPPYRAAHTPITQIEELYPLRGLDAAALRQPRPLVPAPAPAPSPPPKAPTPRRASAGCSSTRAARSFARATRRSRRCRAPKKSKRSCPPRACSSRA